MAAVHFITCKPCTANRAQRQLHYISGKFDDIIHAEFEVSGAILCVFISVSHARNYM